MNKKFETLNHDDVISVDSDDFRYLDVSHTDKVVRIRKAILEHVCCDDVIDCEVLRLGAKGWQKGKVRISLEFCPDLPESPLDDIRQAIKQAES